MDRRTLLALAAGASLPSLSPQAASRSGVVVNDVSQLNPIEVAEERRPRSTDEVRALLRSSKQPVSVGGGRFSMGGQIAAPDSLHLDMRAMNQVVWFDRASKRIRVQAGMRWRDIQDVVDPADLSIRIMQSYSNFTVGGSVSVNCHGRYVGRGPLVNAVQAVQLVTFEGQVLELSRTRDAELFGAVFGGYGGLGAITEVELELDDNVRIERVVERVPLESYPSFFRNRVEKESNVLLHNADLTPPNFDAPVAVSWVRTDKPVTIAARLVSRGLNYGKEQNAIWAITELPGGDRLQHFVKEREQSKSAVVWRNFEASLDTASLEPRTRMFSTYLLQEYFIPVRNFITFARTMAKVLVDRRVEALNVSIRHSPPDTVSLMKWAPTEVFSFVLYYKQRMTDESSARVRLDA
ncbi:MAG TPA: FAD-binding oxidoreductase [Steroidobacter sp.]|uniref:FAD-binding oxidoreductase n=1 Tax=Steroidobacter sp. TaxID=1978227 RepID=UPI002EDA7F03